MATTEQKTQEEVAKNTKRIANLLAMHGANPAEVKAQKKEEKDLINQEKILLDRWEEVVQKQKKDMQEERVKVKSITSFIGLEAKNYFATTEKNMVTWGGLAGSISTGVKDWFDAAQKQRTMLGATLRLGASLWKGVNDHIIGTMKDVFGKIGSHFREVLGELAEVFDVIKGVFKGVFNFLKDTIFGFFKRVPPHQRKRNQLLQKIVDFMRRREKRDMLGMGMAKEKGDTGFWMMVAMALAALAGGMVARFMKPFIAIEKALKLGAAFKKIKDFFMSIEWFAIKVFKIKWTFIKWGRKIGEIFGKAGPLVKFGGVIAKLGRAFLWGFKILGWPLTILIGIYDFIKGFMKTQKTIADKVIAGFKSAWEGFIQLPVKFIGWVVEKVLGFFGVEVKGVADKIMGFFNWIIEAWFGMFRPIIGFFEGFFSGKGISFMDRLKNGIYGFFGGFMDFINSLSPLVDMFEPLKQNIMEFFGWIGDWFGSLRESFAPLLDWFGIDMATTGGGTTTTAPQGSLTTVADAESKKKKAESDSQTKAIVGAVNNQTDKTIKSNEDLAKESDTLAIAIANSKGGDTTQEGGTSDSDKQIQDDVDIYTAVAGNNAY